MRPPGARPPGAVLHGAAAGPGAQLSLHGADGGIVVLKAAADRDPAPAVAPFDFRRARKLSREQVRALQIVYETFARQCSTLFSTVLGTPAQLRCTSLEQLTYDEYVRSLPDPTYLAVIGLDPLPGGAVLQVPLPIVFTAIDRLLGGSGDGPHPKRPLTEIETSVVEGLVERSLRALEYAHESLARVEARLIQQDCNPQFAQVASPGDLALAVSLETRIGTRRATSSLCIPYSTLEPVLRGLGPRHAVTEGAGPEAARWRSGLEAAVGAVPVEAAARFRTVHLRPLDVSALAAGDVLRLGHPVDEPLALAVGDVVHAHAVAGRRGGQLACRIVAGTDHAQDPQQERKP